MTIAAIADGTRAVAPQTSSDAGFFAHHGIWAPGVRLFRALRFNAKAAIISLAFVIPFLGLILWQMDHQATEAL